MSTASASRTIKFVSKGGTYTAMLVCPTGDIYQFYDDAHALIPDWETDPTKQPTLNFVSTSSRTAGMAVVESIRWYVGGVELAFGANNKSTGAYAGVFEKVNGSVPGLKIVKNIVDPASPAPMEIRAEAQVRIGTYTDMLQASYTIRVEKTTSSSYFVTIGTDDSKNFTLTSPDDSVRLKVNTYLGGNEVTEGLTYKFYKYDPVAPGAVNGWSKQSANINGNVLTVPASAVDTYADFKAEVYLGGDLVGWDVQGVLDASDPYEIAVTATPADETVTDDMGDNEGVTYSNPRLVTRGNPSQVTPANFLFSVRSVNGDELCNASSAPFTVTKAMCIQAQGDVVLTIIAQ